MPPASSKTMARELVVPWSSARMQRIARPSSVRRRLARRATVVHYVSDAKTAVA
jgi:hypothetical protein